MIAHTPGPWAAAPSVPEEGSECFWVYSARGQIGCVNGPQNDEQTANANLIAAAPDLLEELIITLGNLKELCYHRNIPRPESTISRAEAAIAKAKGSVV